MNKADRCLKPLNLILHCNIMAFCNDCLSIFLLSLLHQVNRARVDAYLSHVLENLILIIGHGIGRDE